MITHIPPIDPSRRLQHLPIIAVTVLEDRALVRRSAEVELTRGANLLAIPDLAPVLQDVSLRAEAAGATVTDARVQRALRVLAGDKPPDIAALDARLEDLRAAFDAAGRERNRARQRLGKISRMLSLGAEEIPEDAAWGTIDPAVWGETFENLFTRSRELLAADLTAAHQQEDLLTEAQKVALERFVADRLDHHLTAFAMVDVNAQREGTVTLVLEYVVPNAMWRPLHRARLTGERLELSSRAAVWQNTGEDWTDVRLSLSTAQASLGTEPPLLGDDPLLAQRKSDEVQLQTREVAVQRNAPGAGGGGPSSNATDLPGVDDGGEVQELAPDGPLTVPDGGRPVFVELGTTTGPATRALVCMPELDTAVHLAATGTNTSNRPMLAGPVELLRDNGIVGGTSTLYVAPGAPIELGFGADPQLRVTRDTRVVSDKVDAVDRWKHRRQVTRISFSNLDDEPAVVKLQERIPVSEVEYVKILVDDKHTTPGWAIDPQHGFVSWTVTLPPRDVLQVVLTWTLSSAPDVTIDI